MLMAHTEEGIELSHLPFMVREEQGRLRVLCHVARSNPLATLAVRRTRMTAVFSGPHGYVSPRWYAEPQRQVPTWNYMVVHAEGATQAMEAHALEVFIEDLSHQYESPEGWALENVDAAYRRELMRGIVGIELDVEALVGKFKLSQNRSAVDQARVRDALHARGTEHDREMAAWMQGPPAKG